MKFAAFLTLLSLPAFAQYTAQKDGDVVRLTDSARQTVVSIIPSKGNSAFEMKVKGKDVLYFPGGTAAQYKTSRGMSGIPFLGPWANRLDEMAFYANGKKYVLNAGLGNVRGPVPLHGFITNASQWEVVEAKADSQAAWVTSRLEFYKQPDWMAQFPFAHVIEMTYRLSDGVLEVKTSVRNLSNDPMPVSIGFHPYFQVTDAPRDEWTFGIAARTNWLLAPQLVPTGETRPIEQYLPGQPAGGPLKGLRIDDVFSDLVRDSSGIATMWVQGKSEKVEVRFGPNFKSVVVYAPGANQPFICFEPMVGITNAMNLAQKGVYKELQSVQPGQTWQESFWVKPSGF
jgi:aldose 1-epimerase